MGGSRQVIMRTAPEWCVSRILGQAPTQIYATCWRCLNVSLATYRFKQRMIWAVFFPSPRRRVTYVLVRSSPDILVSTIR